MSIAGNLFQRFRRKEHWINFGTKRMTENMANLYRLGYWLMIVGVVYTFG
jgi:hypothetical protein